MAFPMKICSICSEEFELRPDKPGFADRCPACSADDNMAETRAGRADRGSDRELIDARKKAVRDLLYRKDGEA